VETGEFYELQFDKFRLRVPKGYWYAGYDTWVKVEGDEALVGITDFFQTKLGDIAFVHMPTATALEQDDVLATLESAKATVDVTAPASGEVIALNTALDDQPELINQDPYGKGWIARLKLADFASDQSMLLSPQAYFDLMQQKVAKASADRALTKGT
jgi:glycine cleavage system H protein